MHTHTYVAYSKTILTVIATNIFSLRLTGDLQKASTRFQTSKYYSTMPYQNCSNCVCAIY